MKSDFGILFWIHIILIILGWFSWLFFDWKYIFIYVVLFFLIRELAHSKYYGLCPISEIQFADKETRPSFYHYYLQKYFFKKLDKEKTRLFVMWTSKIFLIIISFVIQEIFNYTPIFHFTF